MKYPNNSRLFNKFVIFPRVLISSSSENGEWSNKRYTIHVWNVQWNAGWEAQTKNILIQTFIQHHCEKYRNFSKFTVNSRCGNFVERHSFHTRKLDEIMVFFAVHGLTMLDEMLDSFSWSLTLTKITFVILIVIWIEDILLIEKGLKDWYVNALWNIKGISVHTKTRNELEQAGTI